MFFRRQSNKDTLATFPPMARYANQARKEQRVGLASRAAARSAAAHHQCEAELHEVQGVCTSPRCQQRERRRGGTSGAEDVQVEPSQLIEQSQSLLSPEISEPSQQSSVSVTVEHVNVEMQLTTETGHI